MRQHHQRVYRCHDNSHSNRMSLGPSKAEGEDIQAFYSLLCRWSAVSMSVATSGCQIAIPKDPNKPIAIMVVELPKMAEQCIGIVVSCMPILSTFYRHIGSSGSISPASKTKSSNALSPQAGHLSADIQNFQRRNRGSHPLSR